MAAGRYLLLSLLLITYRSFLQAENLALNKYTSQWGTVAPHASSRAVDGDLGHDGRNGGCAVTNSYDPAVYSQGQTPQYGWWMVDLVTSDSPSFFIQRVRIFNRLDQSRDNIRGSVIKVGTLPDISSQTQCAQIDSTEAIIDEVCNLNQFVRYLSIVSSSATSLHLCEVQVEGYSINVFQKPFPPPTVTEIRRDVVILQINPTREPVTFYQVVYNPVSGRELYGNSTAQTQGNTIEQRSLVQGVTYEIRLLSVLREATVEKATGISELLEVRIPLDTDLPRVLYAPIQLDLSSTSIKISFQVAAGAVYYRVIITGGVYTGTPRNIAAAGQAVVAESIQGLQGGHSYSLTVTPFILVNGVTTGGISSPPLYFTTPFTGTHITGPPAVTQGPTTPPPPAPTTPPGGVTPGPPVWGTTWPNPGSRPPTTFPSHTPSMPPPSVTPTTRGNCTGDQCVMPIVGTAQWVVPTAIGVAGGVLIIIILGILIWVCRRKQNKGADDSDSRPPPGYEDEDPVQYYASTLPQSRATPSEPEEGIHAYANHARLSKISEDNPEPADEDDDELQKDIDMLYAKINKNPQTRS